ncbi:MAG: hypothetical protein KDI37_17750 [Xanthomonadales bacterium]|nr:hypothetical protein [Xanthomonadales bacterium]MCB1634213.1 hypothetical protein [Xanthomonadales bacterium]MCB1643580.1 hypothetical protein [Xanthomonadales bacterium]
MWWLIGVMGLMAVAFLVLLVKLVALRRRQGAIRRFLDSADALESELYECRDRIRALKVALAEIPGAPGIPTLSSLDSDQQIAEALKRLLSNRLWLRNNVDSAAVHQISDVQQGIERSRSRLAAQLEKLEDAGAELAKASTQLPAAQLQAIAREENAPTLH